LKRRKPNGLITLQIKNNYKNNKKEKKYKKLKRKSKINWLINLKNSKNLEPKVYLILRECMQYSRISWQLEKKDLFLLNLVKLI
jgi:hypothetical protein